jgi:voltage-gated potassium channel
LILILVVTIPSIAILQLETVSGSNINSPGDAVWWSLATLTTVGYSDKFPITFGGRIIGMILKVGGVGFFGIISGFVASWFLAPLQKEEESQIDALRTEISELRCAISESQKKR